MGLSKEVCFYAGAGLLKLTCQSKGGRSIAYYVMSQPFSVVGPGILRPVFCVWDKNVQKIK